MRTKRKVANALKKYAYSMDDWVKPIKTIKKLNASTTNVFLLGVMLDRSIDADQAWNAAEWINDSLGDAENLTAVWKILHVIEKKRLLGFLRYGYGGKAFHRYYKTFAHQLPKAAKIILDKYHGDPRKIWNTQRDVSLVRDRLEEIPGIGIALSRMAVLILARNYGLLGGRQALKQLDIKPDRHLMRVFRRCGLIALSANENDAIQAARLLEPKFPAVLDAPSFDIGRKWCKQRKPNCMDCPIGYLCPKTK